MPPRDEQDYEQRRQQIIDGALEVFSSKGFEKATNKDIADAARIGSPGLIYHYFKDKADLLYQVIEQRAPVLQLIAHPGALMDLPPREALTLFARTFLKVRENRAALPLIKLLIGETLRQPAFAEHYNRIGPLRAFTLINRYLSRQMDAGVLRRMDPGAATRCFIGPLILYIVSIEVFPQTDAATLASDTMIETLVEIFLRGMEAHTVPSLEGSKA